MNDLFRFDPPADDALGVLTSTALVVHKSPWVRLDPGAVTRFARAHRETPPPQHEEEALHCTFLEPQRFLNYLVALEALNFCFWDSEPRWRVRHEGRVYDGYWALAAALRRAIREDGLELWDAGFLAGLDMPQVSRLLRGEGRPIPLLEQRLANLREVGQVLMERWEGQFGNVVQASGGDAARLVAAIVAEFPSFDDRVSWTAAGGRETTVRFYKRAQICAADLARLLPSHPLGRLQGIERLTAFADYKVPQVMRAEGILVLVSPLAGRVDRGEELPAGSGEEVAIRAATIWGCEWIARALNHERAAKEVSPNAFNPATAAKVDYLLWSAGQDSTGLPPYHRTRTGYY